MDLEVEAKSGSTWGGSALAWDFLAAGYPAVLPKAVGRQAY